MRSVGLKRGESLLELDYEYAKDFDTEDTESTEFTEATRKKFGVLSSETTRDERRKTKDQRRKTKDERRETKDERRETRDQRRKTKDRSVICLYLQLR
jgi:hypothetical protein